MGDFFQPDRLPDTGRPCVVATSRVKVWALFSPAVQPGADIVLSLHYQVLFNTRLGKVCQINCKGSRTTVVLGNFNAVYINCGNLINCTKMQENPAAAPFFRDGNGPMIKKCRNKILVCDTGEFAFRRERNEYLLF